MKNQDIEPYIENKTPRDYEREEAYIRAQKRVDKIVGFYWHLFWYVIVNIFIVFLISRNLEDNDFWSIEVFSTPIFWGIGLFFHFMGVFGPNLIFGKAWEKRQIEKYMEKDKNQWE